MNRVWAAVAAALLTMTVGSQAVFAADPPASAAGPGAPLAGKQIVVSLGQEKVYAYENGKLAGQSIVTSGGPLTRTPIGAYAVLEKRSNFYMSSPWPEDDWRWYATSWVNYALLFQSSGYFLHDAPWRHNFGLGSNAQAGTLGGDFTGTHGCVNVPFQFERDLYAWADIGTPVTVRP